LSEAFGNSAGRDLPERLLDSLSAMTAEMERYKGARFAHATSSSVETRDRMLALELLRDLERMRPKISDQ
jgi:hypothetical protein